MLKYNKRNKHNSRNLRSNQTDAELLLWSRIRARQINNIQFYRQKPIGNYIVDFYAPAAKLVIEVDGSQHFEEVNINKDKIRDDYLRSLTLMVFRFDNLEVLKNIESVLTVIYDYLLKKNPPVSLTLADPLFQSGLKK